MVAAHRYTRLNSFRTRYPRSALASLVEAVAAAAPEPVRKVATGLDVSRSTSETALIGAPFTSARTPLTDEVIEPVAGWLTGRQEHVEKCFEALQKRDPEAIQGVVLGRVTLMREAFSDKSVVELTTPAIQGGISLRFGDDLFTSCLHNALEGLPEQLLPLYAELTVPLIFNLRNDLLARIR